MDTLARPHQSILLVQGKRVPAKRPPGRPAAGRPALKTVVVHETLANLSRLPAELVALVEGFCQGTLPAALPTSTTPAPAAPTLHMRPCYGLLAGLHAMARELGIVRAVGETTRPQRLALYLIYARLAPHGSRLSAARASEDHAAGEVLQEIGRAS